MVETIDIPQLAPIWSGKPLSDAEQAKLDALAAEADAERAANEAREAELLAASGAIPGSLADLRAVSDVPGCLGRFEARAAALRAAIERGEQACCGEWQSEGYYGWCSRLGRPTYFREVGRDQENRPILRRCDRCPVAMRMADGANEAEAWVGSFFSFLEDLKNGDGIVRALRS